MLSNDAEKCLITLGFLSQSTRWRVPISIFLTLEEEKQAIPSPAPIPKDGLHSLMSFETENEQRNQPLPLRRVTHCHKPINYECPKLRHP